ncbi:MAG: hypothetical protein LBR48_04390 [Dysgonamonadaceae bacterium]|nr:hypothetical protein [Dysgonamonadaceae bacterium]
MDLFTRQRLAVIDADAGEKFKRTGDARYSASTFRLVMRKNLKDGEIDGWFVNILPEAEYLEKKDFKYSMGMSKFRIGKTLQSRHFYLFLCCLKNIKN